MASYHELAFGGLAYPGQRPSFGSRLARGLVKLIVGVGVPLGAMWALYRNDVLYAWSQQLGREADFLRLERAWLGGAPAWGTPRSLRPLLEEGRQTGTAPSDATAAVATASVTTTPVASPTATANATSAPAAQAVAVTASNTTSASTSTTSGVKVVSLDSLPTETRRATRSVAAVTPVAQAPAEPPPRAARAVANPAPRVREEAPAVKTRAAATSRSVAAEPAPAKAAKATPAKAPPAKAAPPPADDNPLKAAIRAAILKDK